ncbi:MAG: glycoside hydrolase family 3 N-terminal domain-containing protein [Candidatus Gastranaerophilales bacterium]|nr:glycoside hydrolase family 3 N-terminal domain-containing protein [Candidatus Gastranaerophilales bacterium]
MGEKLINKIYQMFILGLEGENLSDNPNLVNVLNEGLGGVIFFTQNIQSPEQFKTLIQDIESECKINPFLSIDQEGGRVERTENIFGGKKYLSPRFAAAKGEKFLKEQTDKIAKELKKLGINLNFAPVLDVNTNPDNPIIGERAFSDNTDEVIKYGKIVVETYLENGIIPCVKHFPGHGDASVDSHIALPTIDLPLEEMEKIHIKPFKEVPSPMVMVAHLHCTAFDKEKIPASLSKNAIGYLREKLNYQGLVITDDMVMGALNEAKSKEQKVKCEMENFASPFTLHAAQAIKVGVNILLYRNSYDETIQIIEELVQLAKSDEDLRNNIELSYEKIIECKK